MGNLRNKVKYNEVFHYGEADWDSLRNIFAAYPWYSGLSNNLSSLSPSSLTQFNLVWIFLFHLPINLAKSLLQSGSIHNVQKLSNIKTTGLNNRNYTKLHIQEFCLYTLVTYPPKPSIMPNPPLSDASTIKLLHVEQDLAPSGP